MSETDRFNEYIMTSLRTIWGTNLNKIEEDFGKQFSIQVQKDIKPFLAKGHLTIADNIIRLTESGKLFADGIAAELFAENIDYS